jgi:hypothetical protein
MSVSTTVYPSSPTVTTDSRAVRFESQCELIPEPQTESLIRKLGKSFTLLKRSPEAEVDSRGRIIEERFSGRGVGQSSRTSPSPFTDDTPLVPCIVNRDGPSSSPSSPISVFNRPQIPRRRASLPTPPRADIVTIPLRPCCVGCETIWEESQKEGEQWKEKFSKGARRLRSLSPNNRQAVHRRHGSLDSTRSFSHIPTLTIKVDEVDRRKSCGDSRPAVIDSPNSADTERRHASDSLVPSSLSTSRCVKTSLPEDNEDQLFPLPLNKRSPSVSPSPSPTGSSSSLHATGLKHSPSSSRESIPQRSRIPTPIKSDSLRSPPPPSPISKSFSAPIPSKNLALSVGSGRSSNKSLLDSESVLGSSITRGTGVTPKKSKIWSTGLSITKAAGAGLLKGAVSSINAGPGMYHP